MNLPILNCDGCGVCCMHMAVPPYHDDEFDDMPENVREDFVAVREARQAQFSAHGTDYIPCGWFDMVTRKCRHYEHRPEICREFELGCDACRGMRSEAGL